MAARSKKTPESVAAFLKTLRETGVWVQAAAAAGVGYAVPYDWRRKDPAFARQVAEVFAALDAASKAAFEPAAIANCRAKARPFQPSHGFPGGKTHGRDFIEDPWPEAEALFAAKQAAAAALSARPAEPGTPPNAARP